MSKVRIVVRGNIHEGRLDDFKSIVRRIVQNVRDKDTQTLDYSWYIDESAMTCTVIETYPDWSAFLAHAQNLGTAGAGMGETCSMSLEAFAHEAPSGAAQAALARFGAPFIRYFDGLE